MAMVTRSKGMRSQEYNLFDDEVSMTATPNLKISVQGTVNAGRLAYRVVS
jgi:hypothetical protein